jgi:hypothetical protein
MVHLQCLSKRSDPNYVGGILYYGKWQENKDFLLTLFEPEAPAIIDYLEPPATRFDDLLLEDDLSSVIHIHKGNHFLIPWSPRFFWVIDPPTVFLVENEIKNLCF